MMINMKYKNIVIGAIFIIILSFIADFLHEIVLGMISFSIGLILFLKPNKK